MAVVLSSEETSYFSSSTLRRSHSQPKFITQHPPFHTSASTSHLNDIYSNSPPSLEESITSSEPSSPRTARAESADFSWSSTPASNFSLPDCVEVEQLETVSPEERILFPHYDKGYFPIDAELEPPPSSSRSGDSDAPSPTDQDTSAYTSRPESPQTFERAEDDIAIRPQPSRHVDYLSHDWREEDIWSSWKLIVARRGDYSNSARLENASWRTWMKAKNKLSTVSPETLNWLKDCDVTWLYGPLQTGASGLNRNHHGNHSPRTSKSASANKKPILKKRSMSEVMLQRSLSTSSLVKQAAAAVQAQQNEGVTRLGRRPCISRATTDYLTFPFATRRVSRESTSRLPSLASSGLVSPSSERKHIHFNEQVAQCIAVDVKGDDDDDDVDMDPYAGYGSDSDDGAIMMKRSSKKRRPILRRARSHTASNVESKTIAMLPSTTLKYRDDTPEPMESALKHSYRSPEMSPSSSQETLRPSKKSGKLFFGEGDEDDDADDQNDAEDDGPSQSVGWRSPPMLGESSAGGLKRSSSTNSLNAEPTGMRRTESGMFMPFEEGEPALANEGIFGRIVDTVNTARDIAHVIWNVGWRK